MHLFFLHMLVFFSIIYIEKQRAHVFICTEDKSSLPIERKIWNKNILPQTLIYVYIHRYLFLMYHQQKWHRERKREEAHCRLLARVSPRSKAYSPC